MLFDLNLNIIQFHRNYIEKELVIAVILFKINKSKIKTEFQTKFDKC